MSIGPTTARPLSLRRALLLLPVLVAVALFFAFRLDRYVTLLTLADNREWLLAEVARLGIVAPVVFTLLYAALVAASIPGASFLTIAGGFLFGTALGAACSILGATAGATAIFLLARTAVGEAFRTQAGPFMGRLGAGFRRNALSYLLFLRLVPLFPFFVVNLVPAFLGVRLSCFALGTFVGILPGTIIYSGVGSSIGALLANGGRASIREVSAEPRVWLPLLALALLALAPVAYRSWRGQQAAR